ncbi:hypothetical protein PybrP1_010316 [[Pythium] brassicae (nom. inval.)]|nr:hypothetical protein PybrP1_010316 [[Pythium] brassicae (nom. inval.)]
MALSSYQSVAFAATSPTWNASERMALPELSTAAAGLPALNLQGLTLRSPSLPAPAAGAMAGSAQSPAKKRVRALPNASKSITLDLLRPHFEKPLAEVAAMFGICMTLMKKICRKNGVPRWPHRQIRGLRKSIWSIEKALRCCDSDAQRRSYSDHLHKQRAKLATILRGPDGASRAAFDKILSEPLSPVTGLHLGSAAPSPVFGDAAAKQLSSLPSLAYSPSSPATFVGDRQLSFQSFAGVIAASSPVVLPVSNGEIRGGAARAAVVKLPPITTLLRQPGEYTRTGYFSGTFRI